MPAFREAEVAEVLEAREGLCRVRLVDGDRAYALTELTGPVAAGDRVVVNTTAVDRGLGSGGWHVVHWNLSAPPYRHEGPGHLVKLRYTSLQVDTGVGEETGGDVPARLDGMPVVAAGVHSQLPVVAAAVAAERPGTRVAYVMTDGAALPLALSDHVARLRELDLLVGTVTAGHAFGGDVEALNVASALALARHRLGAELVVVAMGPGGAGTGSRLGFTALEVAGVLDAAAWLGGRPIACLRCSDADPRPRHQGISHHSTTALDSVRSTVEVPHPAAIDVPAGSPHTWRSVDGPDPTALLDAAGLVVTTMGRGPLDDPLYFRAAVAAGTWAARSVAIAGPAAPVVGAVEPGP